MSEVVEVGSGDEADVEAGRCCPTCRHMLPEHNRTIWDAGYSVGVRHQGGEESIAVAGTRLHEAIYHSTAEEVNALPDRILSAYGSFQGALRREGVI